LPWTDGPRKNAARMESDAVDGKRARTKPPTDDVWKEWMRQVGRHNRRVREFLGLSQDELAQRAGVSQGAVSRFESGRGINTPFLAILRIHLAIAHALRELDPGILDDQVKKFLKHMEFFWTPGPVCGFPPAPAGVPVPNIQVTSDPDVERLVRQYRAMSENNRRAFIATLNDSSRNNSTHENSMHDNSTHDPVARRDGA
jgi:transcriptional regulator with XRE-family HTH domain